MSTQEEFSIPVRCEDCGKVARVDPKGSPIVRIYHADQHHILGYQAASAGTWPVVKDRGGINDIEIRSN